MKIVLLIVTVSLLLSIRCGTQRTQRGQDKNYNLILITVDTLRADYLGLYGYPEMVTPNLDRLGRRSLVFERAYATAPFTGPSHASILTSQHPSRHGIIFNGHSVPGQIAGDSITLAQHLKKLGFATAAVVSALPVGKKYGFARGFDSFKHVRRHRDYEDKGGPGILVTEKAKKWLTGAIKQWQASDGKKRFFLWIHYFDPHLPYICDASVYETLNITRYVVTSSAAAQTPVEYLKRGYRADVFEADKQVGALLEHLKNSGGDTCTVTAVASDHGEYLGEKGMTAHTQLYNPVLHVPMFIHTPDMTACIWRKDTVSTIDLAPTLLALLSVPELPTAQGRNLLEKIPGVPVFAEWRDYRLLKNKKKASADQFLVSVQEGNTKLIRSIINPRKNLLFDLAADPAEETNRVFKDRKLYKHLSTILDRHIKKDLPNGLLGGDNIKIDRESIKMLKSLGYIK